MSESVAWVALGSNQADPARQVSLAINALSAHTNWRLLAHSSLYASKPMSGVIQDDYVNAVAKLAIVQDPTEFFADLQILEQALGRKRTGIKHEARSIDLDFLWCAEHVCSTQSLCLPHPGLYQRDFVLQPLCEIDPDCVLPNGTRACAQLIALGTPRLVTHTIPFSLNT